MEKGWYDRFKGRAWVAMVIETKGNSRRSASYGIRDSLKSGTHIEIQFKWAKINFQSSTENMGDRHI